MRDTANDSLSVPNLLSKAAGYFVRSPGDNEAVAGILSLALERAPGNSMAHAMTAFCRFREYEFSPIDMPSEVKDLIAEHLR